MVVIDNESINLEFEERINIESKVSLVKEALNNNEKIEDKLNVISVISNVCEFKTRWRLMKEFIERMNSIQNINFYVVELAYDDQEFNVTNSSNPNHLQIRTKYALWHKENMINIGIKKLLPSDWKSVAWIDGDIEFDNPKVCKLLNTIYYNISSMVGYKMYGSKNFELNYDDMFLANSNLKINNKMINK